jgi:CrcB protein
MAKILLIGIGGFIGSILRYALSGFSQSLFRNATFPLGTVVINVSGCFVIGLLAQLAESRNAFTDLTRAFAFIGILGGYTTFSTFSNESINLFRSGENLLGIVNVVVQVVGGLAFVWLGRLAGQGIWR